MHIRFRRGGALVTGERPEMGEPIWDSLKSRLGIFNNVGDMIEWYPRSYGGLIQLNAAQYLSGETLSGSDNNIYLDWGTANELMIRNAVSGAVLARFTDSASYLLNPTEGSTTEAGVVQRILNGNLSVLFSSNVPAYPMTTTGMTASKMVIPNWLLWRGTISSGAMSVALDNSDAPPGTQRSFLVNSSGAPNNSGLRSFIYDYGVVRNREIVVYGSYKGPNGRSCVLRVSNQFGEIYRQEFGFNAVWEEKQFAFNVPDVDGKFLAIDFVYAPSQRDASLITFRAGKFGCSIGRVRPRYESRSSEMERGMLQGITREGSIFVTGTAVGSIDLGLHPEVGVELAATSPAGLVTLQQITNNGAAASIAGASGLNRIDYRASSIIRTAETN